MNLLMVLHQYLPRHVTGTEQYVRSLALGFAKRGHSVRIFAFEPMIQHEAPDRAFIERDEKVDGIDVRRIALHPELAPNRELADHDNPLASQLFGRCLDSNPVDLVHVFHPRLTGSGAIREPKVRDIPVVVNLMDFWFLCPNFLLLRRTGELCDGPPNGGLGCVACLDPALGDELHDLGLTDELAQFAGHGEHSTNLHGSIPRRAYALLGRKELLFEVLEQADEIVAPSKFMRSVFEDQGFPPRRIRHVPYGIDDRRFRGNSPRKKRPGTPVLDLGYVGSLTPHKGVDVLITAVRDLSSDRLRLHIHGSLDAHPEYSARLRGLAQRDPRIVFHAAFEPDKLGAVLGALDLLVVPSLWYENTPFSVLEALHAGLPVLASDLGGITELVDDGVNGMLFPVGDSDSLANAIQGVLKDPSRLGDLQVGARVQTIEKNLDALEALYAPLLETSTG